MKRILTACAIAAFAFAVTSTAAILEIPQPDAAYLAATSKIDISGIADFTVLGSITDGTQTVTFSSSMEKRTVPGTYATWSSPPWSESATPPVLFSMGGTSNTLTLSVPVGTFGFELEPNPFADHDFTVTFVFSAGPTVVGVINKTVNGNAGARLFAAVASQPVDRVDIVGTSAFAIAQVRYGAAAMPIDIKPGDYPNSINPDSKGVIPVAVLTTSTGDGDPFDFDATTVDPTTARFGPNWAAEAHANSGHLEDVDEDGDLDLVLHFRTQETGIACGDTVAVLKAMTYGGDPVQGVDEVRPVPCDVGNAP